MPDSGKRAQMTYSGDDSSTTFPITFTYSENDDIIVTYDEGGGAGAVAQNRPSQWDYDSGGVSVVFVDAPNSVSADNIVITRATNHPAPLVSFTDSAPITAAQLTASVKQALHYLEEVHDLI